MRPVRFASVAPRQRDYSFSQSMSFPHPRVRQFDKSYHQISGHGWPSHTISGAGNDQVNSATYSENSRQR
jgi:hypothetical protein